MLRTNGLHVPAEGREHQLDAQHQSHRSKPLRVGGKCLRQAMETRRA
ncbi:hypothetical protein [Hoeflea sp.]